MNEMPYYSKQDFVEKHPGAMSMMELFKVMVYSSDMCIWN
jgi:hypothetical protein